MIRIKRAGWIYIFLTIALGIGAVNTGNNLIYIIVSAFLSFMALSGFVGKRNISNLEVHFLFPEEVYASREAIIKVTLRNKRRFLPAFLIKVRVCGIDILYPYVDPQKDSFRHLKMTFPKRGIHKLGDVQICSVFPFNFFRRCKNLRTYEEVIVFPEPREGVHWEYGLVNQRKRGQDQSQERGYEGDLLSLRDYVPGDPLKYIHWKASAKTDRLKIKELSSLTTAPSIIDVDRLMGKDMEERLSLATHLVLRHSKAGLPFSIRIKGRLFNNQAFSKKEILRELALY